MGGFEIKPSISCKISSNNFDALSKDVKVILLILRTSKTFLNSLCKQALLKNLFNRHASGQKRVGGLYLYTSTGISSAPTDLMH